MLGLPTKQKQQAAPTGIDAQSPSKISRRRPTTYILVPTLVGSMVIMKPWRVSDDGQGRPEIIPPIE